MATVAKANLDITATNNTRKAFGQVDRSFGAMKKSLGGVKAALGLAFGAAAIAGLAVFVKKQIEIGDAIAKNADKIGITTDALQEWRHAADLVGVEQSKLDNALEAFSKRLGEVRVGTGALSTFLVKYDKDLLSSLKSAKSTSEALDIYTRAMAAAGKGADLAALSAAGFGRAAGVQMGLLVKNGREELQKMREEAHRLGLVIDEDLLRGAEGANDELTRLGKILSVTVTKAVLEHADAIAAMARGLIDLIPKVSEYLKAWGIMDSTPADEVARLTGEIDTLTATLKTFPGWFLTTGTPEIQRLIDQRQELVRLRSEIQKNFETIKKGQKETGTTPGGAPASGPTQEEINRSMAQPQFGPEGSLFPSKADMQGMMDEELAEINEKRLREFELGASRVAGVQDALRQKREAHAAMIEKETAAQENLSSTLMNTGVDSLTALANGYGDLKSVAIDALGAIVKATIEYMTQTSKMGGSGGGGIFGMLANFGMAGIGSLFGGGSSAMFSGSAGYGSSGSAGFHGSDFGGFRAEGGPTMPGKSYVVGENGPELWSPNSAGHVTPNGGGAGGVTINQTVNIHPDVSAIARQEMLSMLPMVKQAAAGAVVDGRNRAGASYFGGKS